MLGDPQHTAPSDLMRKSQPIDARLGGFDFSATYNYRPASVPEPGSFHFRLRRAA
jgi:hypothetical protein